MRDEGNGTPRRQVLISCDKDDLLVDHNGCRISATAKPFNPNAQGRAAHPGLRLRISHAPQRGANRLTRVAGFTYSVCRPAVVAPFQGAAQIAAVATQGALRDPGLWSFTPSACSCVRREPVPRDGDRIAMVVSDVYTCLRQRSASYSSTRGWRCHRLARWRIPFLATSEPAPSGPSPAWQRRRSRRCRAGEGKHSHDETVCSNDRNIPPGKPMAFVTRRRGSAPILPSLPGRNATWFGA
jgi:hypothetical protein